MLEREGVGVIAFTPLAQGLLTDKYLERRARGLAARRGTRFDEDWLSTRTSRACAR